MQLELRLQQSGTYTVELNATDKVSGQRAALSFPIKVTGGSDSEAAQRATVATSVTATGTVVRRGESKKAWQLVAQKGALHSGDLILGLPGAVLASRDGAVRLTMHTGFVGLSPYPVIESAVQLRDNPSVDLDFTLDRGRVELVNRKKTGPAHVQVHVRQDAWDLTLAEPESRVALELSGRWPAGVPFTPNPGPKDAPTAVLVFLVLHGASPLGNRGGRGLSAG
jgi:hypothetical protein